MGEVLVTWVSKIVKEMLYNVYANTAMIKVWNRHVAPVFITVCPIQGGSIGYGWREAA